MDINESPKHSHFRIGDLKNATNQGNVNVIITIFLRSAKLHNKNHNQTVLKIKITFLTLRYDTYRG